MFAMADTVPSFTPLGSPTLRERIFGQESVVPMSQYMKRSRPRVSQGPTSLREIYVMALFFVLGSKLCVGMLQSRCGVLPS